MTIFGSTLKYFVNITAECITANYSQNLAWTPIIHLDLGYCYTFDIQKLTGREHVSMAANNRLVMNPGGYFEFDPIRY